MRALSDGGLVEGVVLDGTLDLDRRVALLRSLPRWFADVIAPRAKAVVTEDSLGFGEINSVLFMWWDVIWSLYTLGRASDEPKRDFSWFSPKARAAIVDAVVDACRLQLRIAHLAMQESALHGLGHVEREWHGRAAPVVAAFLASHPGLPPKLAAYADEARRGDVQ